MTSSTKSMISWANAKRIWSGDSGTPTFVKDEQNGKLYWLGNKWGGFPMTQDSESTQEIIDFVKGATSDKRPTGYDWKVARLSGGGWITTTTV